MVNFVEDIFSANLRVLKAFGLFPYKNHTTLFKVHFLIMFIGSTFPLPLLCFAACFTDNIDMNRITQNFFIAFEILIIALRNVPFYFYGQDILSFIYKLNEPIFNTDKPRQMSILRNGKNICRKCFWLFLGSVWTAAPFYCTYPIILKSNQTPIDIWTPFEKPVNSWAYFFSYMYVVFGSLSAATTSASYDTLLPGLLYQMALQVNILKDNLTHLDEDVKIEIVRVKGNLGDENIKARLMHENIKKCIIHHLRIIEFVKEYIHYFSFGTFVEFFGGCFVLTVCIYVLSIIEPFSYVFMFASVYTFIIFFQLFLHCYFGTTLYEESKSIPLSIYMGKWYKYDLKSRKLLIMLMERANRPIDTLAGGLWSLNLQTYTMVMRRAYSFYAVLARYK